MKKMFSTFAFALFLTSTVLYGEVVISNPQAPGVQPVQTTIPGTIVNPGVNTNNRFGTVNPNDRFNQGVNNNMNRTIPNTNANPGNFSSQTTPSGMYVNAPK